MPPKVALVTGASRGIGAAVAKTLAREGYAVCVNYHSQRAQAEAVVAEIERSGGKAIAAQADMGSEADIIALFSRIDASLGPVTALVNNAAVNLPNTGTAEHVSYANLMQTLAVNVGGVMLCCHEAVKRMRASGGAIVNISSEAAKFGGNRIAGYAASKGAVNTLTIGLARELAAYNIRVNAVSPGVIDTDAHAAATPERLEGLKSSIPLGRLGSADEVAEAVAWLLSEKASYVSGSIISVTGAR